MESDEELLARLVEEYHRRSAQGARPSPEEFREQAGACYERLLELLRQEALLDSAIEGGTGERFPRTFGEYTLLELLGRGGIGNVYKAVHRPLARTVALKVLQGGWADDAELVERFQRGARAAAQVEHDHVVRIHDVGVFEGRPFIAMSLVAGSDLNTLFKKLRVAGPAPFTPTHHAILDAANIPGQGTDTAAFVRRVAALLAGPAEALDLYHCAGILHRDVKPGNLLLDRGGRLVLTDFDLARRFETGAQTAGNTLGTPGYMSPEQWDPLVTDVDARSDVYSLGCVLYEALTRRPPFHDADDPARLMKRVLSESAPDAVQAVPDLGVDARRVVAKALERRREDRYASAAAFAADLRALARSGSVAARPVPLSRRLARRVLRRRAPLAAALLTALVALLLWASRGAHLSILPWPDADVWLDGVALARTPIKDRRVSAGEHDVVLRRAGFGEHRVRIDLAAGESRTLDPRLAILDENDPAVLWALFEAAGIRTPQPPPRGAYRTEPARRGAPLPLLPRGKVRRADCATFEVEAAGAEEADLVLENAGGHEVWRKPLRLVAGRNRVEGAPALTVGTTYRWRAGGSEWVEFTVVKDLDLTSVMSVRADGHASLADKLEIRLLHQAELFTAVLVKARGLGGGEETQTHMLSIAIEALGIGHSAEAGRIGREVVGGGER